MLCPSCCLVTQVPQACLVAMEKGRSPVSPARTLSCQDSLLPGLPHLYPSESTWVIFLNFL